MVGWPDSGSMPPALLLPILGSVPAICPNTICSRRGDLACEARTDIQA
jgi:hypothetical protein